MSLGVNLCFAVKRMPEPARWAAFVREELQLEQVQFSFDLLDPWWPATHRDPLIKQVLTATHAHDLVVHSAFVGLAHYVPCGLLDPDLDARLLALRWWERAIEVAAELGAGAVGGPLGTMSDADFADPTTVQRRYGDLLGALTALSTRAAKVGLREILVEPTPIAREFPATIDQCNQLLGDLAVRGVTNVGLTLDTGHVLFQPLHGPRARMSDWIEMLGPHIRQLHLDNSDGHGDPHWGWPHPHGRVDVAALAGELREGGLGGISVMLEVYPRFEDDSTQVKNLIVSSVEHCRRHFPQEIESTQPLEHF